MLKLLGEKEYEELTAALAGQRLYGLRANILKIDLDEFLKISPFELEAVPWTKDGFYISGDAAPGRHPYYHAGLYYIQEPSAMLPGEILGAEPGERILDICAAPGGKTVQIAAAMKGSGLLVSNDINTERVKALVKNIELCGIRNAIVLNEAPEKLAQNFTGFFDRILIDAPCSGEGMFRKDEAAARSWESFKCERCTKLQEPILHYADRLLKPGGTLVYSTCTFSPEEDEQMIMRFICSHGGYELVEIPKVAGIEGGRPEWAFAAVNTERRGIDDDGCAEECGIISDNTSDAVICSEVNCTSESYDKLKRTARLWPHRLRGEGHFVAKLIKKRHGDTSTERCAAEVGRFAEASRQLGDEKVRTVPEESSDEKVRTVPEGEKVRTVPDGEKVRTVPEDTVSYEELPEVFHRFVDDNMTYFPEGVFMQRGRNLYHLPEAPPQLAGLKTAKFGWFLGTFEAGRFEPSHSLVIALEKNAFKRTLELSADSREVRSYLKGETLMIEGEKGLTAVCVDGITLGWAKQTGDMLKNLYPKGWRRMS